MKSVAIGELHGNPVAAALTFTVSQKLAGICERWSVLRSSKILKEELDGYHQYMMDIDKFTGNTSMIPI
ncbi:hypothetical protein A9Q96_12870 [Rhodobacterales bacterium 52_120_T64]|nr:hypothetical protein A9Q96_12870 [Rhodobacterales bacterium 52_120_T64]